MYGKSKSPKKELIDFFDIIIRIKEVTKKKEQRELFFFVYIHKIS